MAGEPRCLGQRGCHDPTDLLDRVEVSVQQVLEHDALDARSASSCSRSTFSSSVPATRSLALLGQEVLRRGVRPLPLGQPAGALQQLGRSAPPASRHQRQRDRVAPRRLRTPR